MQLMLPATILEAMAALGLQALLLASLLTSTTGIAILVHDVWVVQASAFGERQVEHLVDVAVARAGAGPSRPAPVANATSEQITLYADLNGDGSVDTSTSEQTQIELRHTSASSPRTLLHRIGNQGMTIEDSLVKTAQIILIGRNGAAAGAADATGMAIPRRGGTLAVAIPARFP
jgi:hypothetical protein